MTAADSNPSAGEAALAASAETAAPILPDGPVDAPAFAVPVRTIAFLSAAAFASAATLRVSDPLLPQVAQEFGVSVGAASIVVTGFALAYGLLQVVYGPVGDRHGKIRVIAVGAGLAALASLACAFTTSLTGLALARMVSGGAAAAIIPLAMAWIGDAVPYDQRQAVLARFLSGQIMGLLFGQAAGGVIGEHFGWRAVFFVIAAVLATASLGLAFERRRLIAARTSPAPRPAGALIPTLLGLLRLPWARTVLAGVFLEGAFVFGPFAFLGADLHARFGLDFGTIGVLLMVYGLGGLAYTLGVRRLVAFFGETGLARLGGGALGLAFTGLAFAPSAAWNLGPILLAGFGFYAIHNTFQTNATQMAPKVRGAAVALFASAFFLGQSLGVALAAPVVDRYGTAPVYLTGSLGIAVLGAWFARRIKGRPASA